MQVLRHMFDKHASFKQFLLQPLADVVMHVEKGYRMEAPEGCPKQIYSLMLRAWNLNPAERPTFKEALQELQNLRSTTV